MQKNARNGFTCKRSAVYVRSKLNFNLKRIKYQTLIIMMEKSQKRWMLNAISVITVRMFGSV